ncbi:MAG: SLBB domain-containing protein [Candidatus Marinimicrobia bacterium]|nr:SLBB domain-containing protein [Candidatus Neomarinimicrobiota bacterium]
MKLDPLKRSPAIIPLLWLILLLAPATSFSQLRLSDIPREVRDELNAQGINLLQVLDQAERFGIDLHNPQQAALRARNLGVPEGQVQQMLRIAETYRQALSSPAGSRSRPVLLKGTLPREESLFELGADSIAMEIAPTGLELSREAAGRQRSRYFGYEVFKNRPWAFSPSFLGPADEAYMVGPGDELRLTVWGAAEFQYDLQVDREGRIYLPNAGQLMVAGKRLGRLRRDMKRWLSRTQGGLQTDPPTIFMDLALTRLRPIKVFVLGEVAQPGGYTLASSSTVFNALYSVGGPLTAGTLRNIRVIRDGKVVANVDFYNYLLKGYEANPIRLSDNDHIFIPLRGKTVAIFGEVKRPAIYELKAGETFSDLLEFSGGLTAAAYTKRIQIERIIPFNMRLDPSMAREVVDVDIEPVLLGKRKIPLLDSDTVRVFSTLDVMENAVGVHGAVKQPGRYELNDTVRTVRDLIAKADGLMGDAFLGKADLVRTLEDSTEVIFSLKLEELLADPTSENMQLLPRDRLFIYSVNELITDEQVTILGAVKQPGEYRLWRDMTVEDLIFQSGGFTEDAYLVDAQLSRLPNENKSVGEKAILLQIPLTAKRLEGRTSAAEDTYLALAQQAGKVRLRHRDIVYIRTDPDYTKQDTVLVRGEVKFPGRYTLLRENETLSDVITRAGGVLPTGYPMGGRLIRDGERVVIRIDEAIRGKKRADIILLSGDEIIIPPSPNTVAIRGNVGLQGLVKYDKARRVAYYLDQAGGLGDRVESIFLTQASGATFQLKRRLWLVRQNPVVDEGALITVTKKPEPGESVPFDLGATIRDTFAIISSAVTIIVLAQQIIAK